MGKIDNKRLLENIIGKIQSDCRHLCFKNKEDWNDWNHSEVDMEGLATDTIRIIKEKIKPLNSEDYSCSTTDYETEKSRTEITFVPSKGIYYKMNRAEEGLEKCLVKINTTDKTTCKAQIVTIDYGHIDFIMNKNNNTTFVELKRWDNSDSPFWAIIENLKNYYLFKALTEKNDYAAIRKQYRETHNIKNVNELLVLAPLEYYLKHNKAKRGIKKEKWTTLFYYVKALNKKLEKENVKISLKYIDVPYGDYETYNEGTWCGVLKEFGITKREKINIPDNIDKFNAIKDKLVASAWIDIFEYEEFK